MRLCVVPMKPLGRAKQRLAGMLDLEQRRALSLAMLSDVCAAAAAAGFDATWVVCSDEDAAEVATAAGAAPVQDPTPDAGLNASLDAVTAQAIAAGFAGMLIVSADCPAARADDLTALALGAGVAIATDRSQTGTNALWRQPCDAIPAAFGRMSRRAHLGLAYGHGRAIARVPRERLGLDVDVPRHLADLVAIGPGPATGALLAQWKAGGLDYSRAGGGR